MEPDTIPDCTPEPTIEEQRKEKPLSDKVERKLKKLFEEKAPICPF